MRSKKRRAKTRSKPSEQRSLSLIATCKDLKNQRMCAKTALLTTKACLLPITQEEVLVALQKLPKAQAEPVDLAKAQLNLRALVLARGASFKQEQTSLA